MILAFMAVALSTALLVFVFLRMTNETRFSDFILNQQRAEFETILIAYYQENGSWKNLNEYIEAQQLNLQPRPVVPTPNSNFDGFRDRRKLFGFVDPTGRVLISLEPQYPKGAMIPPEKLRRGTPVEINSVHVGTIVTINVVPGFTPPEVLFLQRSNEALLFATLGALIVAMILGILMARTLIRPIRKLTEAAQNMTKGQLDQNVAIDSQDEIAQLADAFNRMSQEINKVNLLRKQMTADIAHDLRTPITVIAGYIEAMRDEVLKPTPTRLDLIYSEIERMQSLVSDLRMLSEVDSGKFSFNPQVISPETLLNGAAARYQYQASQQKINLIVNAAEGLPKIKIDESRMMQVFGNLMSNSLRYTPAGGQIILSAVYQGGKIDMIIQDNGQGITPQDVEHIFERFYRADPSRHTDNTESGLGLAIAKALVEAQGGKIWAESSLGYGTIIHIAFEPA